MSYMRREAHFRNLSMNCKKKKNSQDIRLKRTAVSKLFIGSGIPVWVS